MILLQHSQELIEKLKQTTEMNVEGLKAESIKYDSVYFNEVSDSIVMYVISITCIYTYIFYRLKIYDISM